MKRFFPFLLLLGALAGARLLLGHTGLPRTGEILELRAHPMTMAIVVGWSLGVAGALLQALMRNPLASPYLIGVSSGAAVGVMASRAALYASGAWLALAISDTAAGLIGAAISMGAVWMVSRLRGVVHPLSLLLVGAIINAINGAAIMFIHALASDRMRLNISHWMLGELNADAPWEMILLFGLLAGAATLWAWKLGPWIDLATLPDDEANSLGLNARALQVRLFVLSGLLATGAVALAGPIGFIGLIGPHLARLVAGPGHRSLVLLSGMVGAALLLGADILARLADLALPALGKLPVGVMTALIGGPLFLWMLRRRLAGGEMTS